MDRTFVFGIVGGYGATGSVVVLELLKTTSAQILVGGRDAKKGKTLAAKFGSRVAAAHLDVLDRKSLDEFCSRCLTVVNCAGPVLELQDRVAQAALRGRCHYVDAAGLSLVRERLLPQQGEIEDLGLSFVISAGWMPGLSELLPAYADAVAKTRMEKIESLTVYFADRGEWSDNAMRDGVWYLRKRGLRSPGYFHKGVWKRAAASAAFRTVNLGEELCAGRFCMFSTHELEEIGRRFHEYDVLAYTYLSSLRSTLAATLMAALPLPQGIGVRLLRNIFRRNRFPVGGFVLAQVLGQSRGRPQVLTTRITFERHQDYWIHGIALATSARLAASHGARTGAHFLADAVDPVNFMAELRKAGVQQSESSGRLRPNDVSEGSG